MFHVKHGKGKHRTPNEVSIKPFQRFAGSQGRALRRAPQSAELSFETRCPARVSIKQKIKARPQTRNLWKYRPNGRYFP